MAEVPLKTLHVIHCNEKKWVVPENYIDDDWLQLPAACYGLCNLLNSGSVGKTPSLKQSKGLQELVKKRNEAIERSCAPSTSQDDDESILKRKRKKPSMAALPSSVDLDLGDHGTLTIKMPSNKREDLKIKFDVDNIKAFCSFMIEQGCECVGPERRKYTTKVSTPGQQDAK